MALSLSPGAFAQVFPFHFVVDRDLKILQTGDSLARLCPDAVPGASMLGVFHIERPTAANSFGDLLANQSQVFVLTQSERSLRLRGQMLALSPDSVAFLCAPWLSSPEEMSSLGLTLQDFALHDPAGDFIQLMQAQKTALADVRELADRLASQRRALAIAHEKLEQQFQELQRAQALTESILETAPDGFLVTAPDGRIVSFNSRFLEMWGIPPDMAGHREPGVLREYVRSMVRDPEAFSNGILRLYANPELENHELIQLVDGRAYDRYSRPRRQGSELIGRVWTYRDVTERWRAQEELRLSEERYRVVAEGASDGILTIDTESRILFANGVCERIFGYTRAELTGMTLTDLMPEEIREQHRLGFQRYLSTGVRNLNWQVVQVPGLRQDGTRVQLELSFGESSVEGKHWFTSIVRDVTELRRTARALEESERRYRSVVDSIQEVVFQTDVAGRLTFLNPAWITVRGEAVEACLGRRTGSYIHPDSRKQALVVFRQLTTGIIEEARHTLTFLRADGSTRLVEVVARALVNDVGVVRGTAGTLTDVTERREWEQRLESARAAAEAANLAKTEFLASISHEIRTPLNAIVGMSELMAGTPLTEEQKDYQSTVRAGAEALLYLIDDLLDVSRIEAGKVDIHAAPFDPAEVCEEGVSIAQSRARQKGIGLYFHCAPALPPLVVGDRNRVRQIVINLLTNAIKFTHEGHVAMHLDWAIEPDEMIELAIHVADTGPGISEGDRERIFDKFVQLGAASRLSSGAGLGLAISRSLANAMGADISVVSQPGEGSTFTLAVRLPRANRRRADEMAFLERCRSLSVLVLSGGGTENIVGSLLSAWGTCVATCADPAAAARRLRAGRFHALASDSSPDWAAEGTGELLEAIRAMPDLKVILLPRQGSHARDWRERLPDCSVIEQPALPSRILAVLRGVLGEVEHQTVRPAAGPESAPGSIAPRLLVAEDNPENQRLVQRILTGAGYQVDVASDGATAVDMATAFRYDAILMDLQMPGLDGFEATAAIRQNEAAAGYPRVPVIALTAHALTEYRERSLAAGMDAFLTKPVLRDHLLSTLRHSIDKRPLVLAVDDDPLMLRLIVSHAHSAGSWRVITASSDIEALAKFVAHNVALVIIDVELGASDGLDVARRMVSSARLPVPVVALTGHGGDETGRRARSAGCVAHLVKPLYRDTLLTVLRKYAPVAEQQGDTVEYIDVDPDLADLIPAFLEDMRACVASMSRLASGGDSEGVRKLAHRVKGAGGGYNFHTVTAMGRSIEARAASGDLPGALRVISQLQEYLLIVKWRPHAAGSGGTSTMDA